MLTDLQVAAIETACTEFDNDVGKLKKGALDYQIELRKANEASRLNGLAELQRASPTGYQKVMSVLTKEQKAEVESFVATYAGKDLPSIAATSLSQFRGGKPPKTTFP